MKDAPKRIPTLDGWRGIAILMVLIAHAQVGMSSTFLGGHSWLIRGRDGVAIFFVLSGFLITSRLLAEPNNLRKFYVRRFFRLMPAAWLYVASAVLVGSLAEIRPDRLSIASALGCFRNYLGYTEHGDLLIGHFWSLSMEEQFYFLWPALLLVLGHKSLPFAIAAFTGFSAFVYCRRDVYLDGLSFRPEMNAHLLLAGCVLALAFEYERVKEWFARWSWILFPSALLGFSGHLLTRREIAPPTEAVCIALCLGATCAKPLALFDWKPLAYLGKISYSLYLWQQMFLLTPLGWLCLPLALSAGVISYTLLEQPGINLGARLVKGRAAISGSPTLLERDTVSL